MPNKVRWIAGALAGGTLVLGGVWAATELSGDPREAVPTASPSLGSPTSSPRPTVSPTPRVVFAKDACVSFPADGTERGVVFLDPGHGGLEPGAIGRTSAGARVPEKTATLAIVKVATEAFRERGYRVVVSRWADTTVHELAAEDVENDALTPLGVRRDLLARAACANIHDADVLLSMHLNSFKDSDVGGASMIYNAERTFTAENRRLAALLQARVLSELRDAGWEIDDRKIMDDTANPGGALTEQGARYGHSIIIGHYEKGWVDNPSLMPGVIMEPLFISRPEEAEVATSLAGQRALARAMVAAVEEFLSG